MRKSIIIVCLLAVQSQVTYSQFAPNYFFKSDRSELEDGEDDGIKVDLIGSASLAGGGSQSQGRGASGIAFYKTGVLQGDIVYSLGNTSIIDFVKGDRNGGALLVPGNGSQSLQFDFRKYGLWGNKNFGYNISVIGASGEWRINNVVYNVSPVSLKLQGSGLIFQRTGELTTVLVTADLGISYRGFLGDASTEHDLKEAIFGTTQTGFVGAELGVDCWLNDTHFYFYLPYLFGDQVRGLTNGQITIGVAVSGTVLKDLKELVKG